ncbi:MAG: DUF1592 domain-containing protein [Planctomycetaceae bacterium]
MLRHRAFSVVIVLTATLSVGGTVRGLRAAEDEAKLKEWQQSYERDIWPIVQARCQKCHSGDEPQGGFDVTPFASGEAVSQKLEMWDEVGKRVRLREMPPEGSPQLNDAQKGVFHRWLDARPRQDFCSQLATDETQSWYRGYVMSRRLTRTEYLNAVRDAVGVPIDSSLAPPSDGSGGEGFDTNGDTLFTSPIHIEQYLAIASQVVNDALPEVEPEGTDPVAERVRAARTRLLVSLPGAQVPDEQAAREVIRAFTYRAWRRPVSDTEVDSLLSLYLQTRASGGNFVTAVRQPLKAALVSPNFLFVVEAESPTGGVQRLTPYELALRLSLLVWSSIPDDELLRAAEAGELDTNEQVITQLRRMLADPRARAIGENFGLQWLGLANFRTTTKPDAEVFPAYTEELADDLREEAIRFVADVFREDRSLLELIDAPYVTVNGRLAQHYGLALDPDADWQRLETADRQRGGVVTLGAALMTASYPRRTSPVLRGRWVLEEVLGSKVPPPPAGVPALEESEASHAATLRERLELHRQKTECAACHDRMDPLGFGLDNFDALGRWRETDNGQPIDSTGKLPSGQTFSGPAELKRILLQRGGEFEKHLVRKLLGFALGRDLNKFDQCVIDECLKRLKSEGHRSGAVLETIVTSYPFQHRYFKAAVAQ